MELILKVTLALTPHKYCLDWRPLQASTKARKCQKKKERNKAILLQVNLTTKCPIKEKKKQTNKKKKENLF